VKPLANSPVEPKPCRGSIKLEVTISFLYSAPSELQVVLSYFAHGFTRGYSSLALSVPVVTII
jgi:hypothetical protein